MSRVWVILGADGRAIEILKNEKHACQQPAGVVTAFKDRGEATGQIRKQVFVRDKYACTHCGNPVTWYNGHMHERVWRGRGGEISVENSTTLCPDCHDKDPVAGHGTRMLRWSHNEHS